MDQHDILQAYRDQLNDRVVESIELWSSISIEHTPLDSI